MTTKKENPLAKDNQTCFCISTRHDDILQPIWSSRRIEFYKQMTGNDETPKTLKAFANRYYKNNLRFSGENDTKNGEILCQNLESLGPKYLKLVVDPGLMTHIDDFVKFAKKDCNYVNEDPWIVRDLYAKKLGLTTVYRAIKISDEDELAIRKDGMFWSKFEHKNFQGNNLIDDISNKMHAKQKNIMKNEFMSVTKYPEIASLVASWYRNKGRVVLYELQVPKLDLISPRTKRHWDNEKDVSLVCAEKFHHPWVEKFIPFVVESSEIVSINKDMVINRNNTISTRFSDLKAETIIRGLNTLQRLQNKNPFVSDTIKIETEKKAIKRKEDNWGIYL